MKKKLLIIGYNQPLMQDLKRGCLSDGLYPCCIEKMKEAEEELDNNFDYSLVIIFGGINVMGRSERSGG